MKRINSLVRTAAVMLILGTAVSFAQYGSGRALLAYPMNGQTLEQENADRVACHDWAVAQTGYDPTLVYAAQQYWMTVRPGTAGASYDYPRYPNKPEDSLEPWETPRDTVSMNSTSPTFVPDRSA